MLDNNLTFYTIPDERFDMYGISYSEENGRFLRMPEEAAQLVSCRVADLNHNTAGGRLRFSTDSDTFAIKIGYDVLAVLNNGSRCGMSGFVLLEEREYGMKLIRNFAPCQDQNTGFEDCVNLKSNGEVRNYILFFPTYNNVTSLTIGLQDGAFVGGGNKYKPCAPILYYGSSITQGGCCSRADISYEALISRWSNIDYINLGFSGNAKAEPAMAEYLAGIKCSVFVCDYDHNAPDAEHLKNTHGKLYETFRAANPDTPIIFVSRPDFDCDVNSTARRDVIEHTYCTAKANGDGNVYYVDGQSFFGCDDRDIFTVDGTHPNDLGMYKMAKGIYAKIKEIFNK